MSSFNDGNYEKGGDEVGSNISVFETNQLFTSLEELKEWATNVGRENGVVILTQRSKKNVVGNVIKVFLKCDRGGEYKPTATVRRSGTTKTNCPFQLVAKYIQERNAWTIRVICDQHNHDLAQYIHGHPYAMRLSQDEKVMVGEMYSNNTAPRDILAALREKDEKNVSSLVTLYNEGQKVHKEKHKGASPMNVLFQLLQEKGFVHDHRTNPTTNALEDLFFIHPTSYTLYRAFPHVLIIDTTYNTNQYKMPFVQIVGVSSTGKTITIALSFITKKKENNFTWVLTRLRQTLDKIMLPRVIITDRDLALMNACQAIFTNAAKLLCRWHIGENIAKHCKQSFVSGRNWEMFEKLWGILIKSPTVTEYEFNHRRFHDTLIVHHSRVYYYVKTNWLDKYKEMFVSAWIDQNLNFCNNSTNRVESAHALLTKYMLTSNSTLDKFVVVVDRIVVGQESALKETFEISRNKVMNKHNIPLLNELRGKVSHKCLDILVGEVNRVTDIIQSSSGCGCHVRTSCGLPCACLVSKYLTSGRAISVDVVDIFWRKLDFNPLYVEQEDDLECEKDLDLFREQFSQQSRAGKRSMLSKLWAIIKPGSSNRANSEIQKNTRGRPTTKSKQKSKHEPPLKRSNSTSLTGTESWYQRMPSQEDSGRLSSFVGTVDASRQSSAVFSNTMPYSHYYHHLVHPYLRDFVKRIQDVGADGNCGFRAVAVVLGFHEDSWLWIRQQLIIEITGREGQYKHIYGEDFYRTIHRSLNWSSESFAPREHWMDMSSTAFLIANRFGVVVHSLSCTEGQNSTIFPMFYGPHEVQGHGAISILYVGEHFVAVELEGEYPMPPINFQWLHYRPDVAVGWEELYRLRVKKFTDRLDKDNPEPIKQIIDLDDCL